ncbi:MAG: hypothetical protein HZC01_00045 [Candidatus Kerfeldbacteria bacterium]|nr:hypothetical protein [Candidatus Kerfeldbacteria bacterium]
MSTSIKVLLIGAAFVLEQVIAHFIGSWLFSQTRPFDINGLMLFNVMLLAVLYEYKVIKVSK